LSEFSEKLKEPFENPLNQQLLQLDLATAEMDEHKNIIQEWPVRKKKIAGQIIKALHQWAANLKKITSPLDLRRYKREKKRLLRFKIMATSSWRGFTLNSKVALLWCLNLTRILLILSFYIGSILLAVYGLIKVFNWITGQAGGP
jgi:hypothetical protein